MVCTIPKRPSGAVQSALANFSAEEIAEALAEDRKVERILHVARKRPASPMVTEQSVREGAAIMAEFRAACQAAMVSRIELEELFTKEELIERLGGNRRRVNAAVAAGRLFSLQAPSGIEYYPAFFADGSNDRRALGRVANALTGLPGPIGYHFFVSKPFTLGMTPLEALAEGKIKAVLNCAVDFAQR